MSGPLKLGRQGRLIVTRVTEHGKPTGKYHCWFYCPGCQEAHLFEVPTWSFGGDYEKPTFSPSLLLPGKCHLYLQEGKITFLSDSTHELRGRVIDLPEAPKWMGS